MLLVRPICQVLEFLVAHKSKRFTQSCSKQLAGELPDLRITIYLLNPLNFCWCHWAAEAHSGTVWPPEQVARPHTHKHTCLEAYINLSSTF